MKTKTLIPTLAMLLFAGIASAQSDPSVGGSFRKSIPDNSGEVVQHRPVNTAQPHTSFWQKMTGGHKNMQQASTTAPARSHGWFHRDAAPGYKQTASNHHWNWFGLRHDSNLQSNTRTGGRSKMNMHSSAAPASHRWHIPFFSGRQSTHT